MNFKKCDVEGYDLLEDGTLSHYFLIKHYKTESEVVQWRDSLSSVKIDDHQVVTELRYFL